MAKKKKNNDWDTDDTDKDLEKSPVEKEDDELDELLEEEPMESSDDGEEEL